MDINKYVNNLTNYNKFCNCQCYEKWSEIPYPGMCQPPVPIDPTAGTWPLYFMKRGKDGCFYTLSGDKINFNIANPNTIDFQSELLKVQYTLKNLTCHEKSMAKYWGNGVPAQQWVPICLEFLTLYKITPPKSARLLAYIQNAMNDAFVITWMYKYHWNCARPCQLDRSLKTTIPTPIFPTYPSGHSVVSATLEVVLSFFFPDEHPALHQLAEDASISRLYGGVHFKSDLSEGLKLGRQIGAICVEYLKTQPEIEKLIFRC